MLLCEFDGCCQAFPTQYRLRRHVNGVHARQRPYKCRWEGCSQAFPGWSGLNSHLKFHMRKEACGMTGGFKCLVEGCGRYFEWPDSMENKSHRTSHIERDDVTSADDGPEWPFGPGEDSPELPEMQHGQSGSTCPSGGCVMAVESPLDVEDVEMKIEASSTLVDVDASDSTSAPGRGQVNFQLSTPGHDMEHVEMQISVSGPGVETSGATSRISDEAWESGPCPCVPTDLAHHDAERTETQAELNSLIRRGYDYGSADSLSRILAPNYYALPEAELGSTFEQAYRAGDSTITATMDELMKELLPSFPVDPANQCLASDAPAFDPAA